MKKKTRNAQKRHQTDKEKWFSVGDSKREVKPRILIFRTREASEQTRH